MRWFSYPNGDRARSTPARAGCSRRPGSSSPSAFDGGFLRRGAPWDPYDVPRIAVGPRTAGDAFAATVTLPHVFIRSMAGSRG